MRNSFNLPSLPKIWVNYFRSLSSKESHKPPPGLQELLSLSSCNYSPSFSLSILGVILGPLILLFFIPFYLIPNIYSGDEPHYLILANSIRFDRDLELGSDYEGVRNGSNRAGKIFTGKPLDHHTVITISDSNGFSKSLGAWHDFFDADHRARWNIPKPPPLPQKYNEKSARAIGWPLVIAGTEVDPIFRPLAG
jgi:hypothetical protein